VGKGTVKGDEADIIVADFENDFIPSDSGLSKLYRVCTKRIKCHHIAKTVVLPFIHHRCNIK
jgi:hypothetical protein